MRMATLASSLIVYALLSSSAGAQEVFKQDRFKLPSAGPLDALEAPLSVGSVEGLRALPSLALQLIKFFEGWEPRAYDDAAGYCTIGYGHLLAKKPCASIVPPTSILTTVLDEAAGDTFLQSDSVSARQAVQQLVKVELSEGQFGSLSAFVFNVGAGNFAKSSLLRLLNEGEYVAAAGQFPRWVRAGGRVLPGLVTRRACEEAMFNGYLSSNEPFDSKNCQSLGAAPDAGDFIDIQTGETG